MSTTSLEDYKPKYIVFALLAITLAFAGCKRNFESWTIRGEREKAIPIPASFPETGEQGQLGKLAAWEYCYDPQSQDKPEDKLLEPCSFERYRIIPLVKGSSLPVLVESNSTHWAGSMGNYIQLHTGPQVPTLGDFHTWGQIAAIGLRSSENPPFLLIHHRDYERGIITILHEWSEGTYHPSEVVKINGEVIENTSKELHQKYILDFPW